jgi:heme exporter protein D
VIGDNWSFVLAAYALTALVLVAYWRHLVRRERELEGREARPGTRVQTRPAGSKSANG